MRIAELVRQHSFSSHAYIFIVFRTTKLRKYWQTTIIAVNTSSAFCSQGSFNIAIRASNLIMFSNSIRHSLPEVVITLPTKESILDPTSVDLVLVVTMYLVQVSLHLHECIVTGYYDGRHYCIIMWLNTILFVRWIWMLLVIRCIVKKGQCFWSAISPVKYIFKGLSVNMTSRIRIQIRIHNIYIYNKFTYQVLYAKRNDLMSRDRSRDRSPTQNWFSSVYRPVSRQ